MYTTFIIIMYKTKRPKFKKKTREQNIKIWKQSHTLGSSFFNKFENRYKNDLSLATYDAVYNECVYNYSVKVYTYI